MKLREALQVVSDHEPESETCTSVLLACGFSPLHLARFLEARLCKRLPDSEIRMETGLFGDLQGTLDGANVEALDGIALVIEWEDLDPRLGLRRLGGWSPDDLGDILADVRQSLTMLGDILEEKAVRSPVALMPPTLPLPPVSYTPTWQEAEFEAELRGAVADLIRRAVGMSRVRVTSRETLDHRSPSAERLDVNTTLHQGFPYSLSHADEVARFLTMALFPSPRKKGLVTDLDDTLWRGILGEVGPDGIAWELEAGAQHHGLYQQFLASLAEAGTFVAAASKNDPELVRRTFRERNLVLEEESVYPFEVHWEPKSGSISRIVEAWNIAPDSVVFVDDSPHELAEVRSEHPEITCFRFPTDDPSATFDLLSTLRDLFGTGDLNREDRIRVASVRQSEKMRSIREEGSRDRLDQFLGEIEGEITVEDVETTDERAFTLLNKTNQFNLNGERLSEAEWIDLLGRSNGFAWIVSYRDKFGPLGRIAVLAGIHAEGELTVDRWAMSCRAFSRRIEHQCLQSLFEFFGVDEVTLRFRRTDRNGPLRQFLTESAGRDADSGELDSGLHRIRRETFRAACPELHHAVQFNVSRAKLTENGTE